MEEFVEQLVTQSKEYFRGKELEFENKSKYIQCIRHPTDPNTFISVQKVQRSGKEKLTSEQNNTEWSDVDFDVTEMCDEFHL